MICPPPLAGLWANLRKTALAAFLRGLVTAVRKKAPKYRGRSAKDFFGGSRGALAPRFYPHEVERRAEEIDEIDEIDEMLACYYSSTRRCA